MRKSVFNMLAIMVAIIIHSSVVGASTSRKDFVKIIKEEFTISNEGQVNINNRYGKIKVNPTGGNEVVIEVTIKVDKRNEDKAEDFFDKVNIEFEDSRSEVSASTQIGNTKSNSSWTSWLNPKNWNSNDSYSINYEVWMPSNCKLSLVNKYGDIAVGDLENDVKIELKYGDGQLEDIEGDLEVNLAYGDLKVGEVQNLEIEIKYGEFRCKGSEDAKCDTKYSDIYIDKAKRVITDTGYDDYFLGTIETLVNEGGYDDFQIDYVDDFDFDSKYSDYIIKELGSGGVFDSGYGELKIRKVNSLSKGLEIDCSYADVWLGMDIPFNIDLDSKYTDVDIPKEAAFNDRYTRIKDGSEEKIQAKSSTATSNNIEADMRYGSFKIKDIY